MRKLWGDKGEPVLRVTSAWLSPRDVSNTPGVSKDDTRHLVLFYVFLLLFPILDACASCATYPGPIERRQGE